LPKAQRQIKRLPEPIRSRVAETIKGLGENPRSQGVEKLHHADQLYRIRVGDYRILYAIEDRALVVLVVTVGHRREVYREKLTNPYVRRAIAETISDMDEE